MAAKKKTKTECSGCGGSRFGPDGACVRCGRMKVTPGGQRLIDRLDKGSGPKKPK